MVPTTPVSPFEGQTSWELHRALGEAKKEGNEMRWVQKLGYRVIPNLLQMTLEEVRLAARALRDIAEGEDSPPLNARFLNAASTSPSLR